MLRKNAYGEGWRCLSGYRQIENRCEAIQVPDNAYLSNSSFNFGWGVYSWIPLKKAGYALPLKVPQNAYIEASRYGKGWSCNQGFREISEECVAIIVPENGYLSQDIYDTGWKCDRGYRS